MIIFIIPVITAIALTILYAYEQHANNKRIERGEAPKKYHDLTDLPAPVDVIDWTHR